MCFPEDFKIVVKGRKMFRLSRVQILGGSRKFEMDSLEIRQGAKKPGMRRQDYLLTGSFVDVSLLGVF